MVKIEEKTQQEKTTGIGRPDYTTEISKIKRGETYPQLAPRKDTEKYKIFALVMRTGAPYPFSPLAVGETRHFIDIETLLPTPYTHPAGIRSDLREWLLNNFAAAIGLTTYLDEVPVTYFVSYTTCFFQHQYEQIVYLDTDNWDPNRESPHTWDFTLTNRGAVPIVGTVHVSVYLTLSN